MIPMLSEQELSGVPILVLPPTDGLPIRLLLLNEYLGKLR